MTMTESRAETRKRAEWIREHTSEDAPAPRMLLPVADVLELLDALDAADQPGRFVRTGNGWTFQLACAACASGYWCGAHGRPAIKHDEPGYPDIEPGELGAIEAEDRRKGSR